MIAIKRLNNYLGKQLFGTKETAPETAYDLWAANYDDQPDNLMLALDEDVFSTLLNQIQLKDKTLIDVGCGTGRHWKKIFNKEPKKITGFDVSEKMLLMLQQKFPQAETHHLVDDKLNDLADNSTDIIISTLTIAHIKNAEKALHEWVRVLKPGGDIIITDYHPAALAKGGDRTFKYKDKIVAIVNHVHSVNKILAIAGQLNLKVLQLIEKNIDDSVKQYYEKHDALTVFEKWKNTPIIYGLRLKKSDDIK
jgi:ubiquinone/menaquinone biosynthesis C-methylase UbiE